MSLSLAGLLVSAAILAPTLLLVAFPARGTPGVLIRPRLLIVGLERAGQAGCLVAPALTGTTPDSSISAVAGGLVVAVLVAGYYALWVRFFLQGRSFVDLYRRFWILPVPMAVLPVLAYGATALWLGSWWVGVAAAVLACGNIPAALLIARQVNPPRPGAAHQPTSQHSDDR